jgi:hypothetical protein
LLLLPYKHTPTYLRCDFSGYRKRVQNIPKVIWGSLSQFHAIVFIPFTLTLSHLHSHSHTHRHTQSAPHSLKRAHAKRGKEISADAAGAVADAMAELAAEAKAEAERESENEAVKFQSFLIEQV